MHLMESRKPVVQAQAGPALDLAMGAFLEVLAATQYGAVLQLEWDNFRALLPMKDHSLEQMTTLLLADSG
jgi:hypothetical protein